MLLSARARESTQPRVSPRAAQPAKVWDLQGTGRGILLPPDLMDLIFPLPLPPPYAKYFCSSQVRVPTPTSTSTVRTGVQLLQPQTPALEIPILLLSFFSL